jgi:hypothetical protein
MQYDIPEATGTYLSRKFMLACFCIMLITAVSTLSIWFPGIAPILPTFVGGLLGILSLYFTGNVMNKYVVSKSIPKQQAPEEELGEA